MSEVKFCKDCKHCCGKFVGFIFGKAIFDYQIAKCELTIDLVDGSASSLCKTERYDNNKCGRDAKFWEAK